MASSYSQDTQYTHKKFNCGYSHKKLDLRLKRRDSQEDVGPSATIPQDEDVTNSSKSKLFRPYTQHSNEDDSFHLKQQTPNCFTHCSLETQTAEDYVSRWLCYYLHAYPSVQQTEKEYALKLQRQKTALFMKYVLQYYETGNGWPSVHPNVRRLYNDFKS